jgi:hypothetical protein
MLKDDFASSRKIVAIKNYTGECQGHMVPHQNILSGTERNTLLSYQKQGKAGKIMFKFKGIVNRDCEI